MKTKKEKNVVTSSNVGFHNYQIDFVKLKLYKVDTTKINWSELQEHPVLKNHYTLDLASTDYHGKNFDMYIDKGNNITIKMSIPYLLEDQNYYEGENRYLGLILFDLYNLTGINFPDTVVKEFEYGLFEKTTISAPTYIKNCKGVLGKDLLKATSFMKMFGDSEIHYKIYDAIANAKHKKTFTRGNFPLSKLIKHELKFKNPEKTFGKEITAFDLGCIDFINSLKTQLHAYREQLVFNVDLNYSPLDNSITHLLFTSLKNAEVKLDTTVYNLVREVIDTSNLTPSQKSKRRKTLMELETTYNKEIQKR